MHGENGLQQPYEDAETGPDTGSGVEENGKIGDGLVVFEEYRGFYVGGSHTRLDPTKKDIFIYSPFSEGIGYATNLPAVFEKHVILAIGETKDDEDGHTVNFNSLGRPIQFGAADNEHSDWRVMDKQAIWIEDDTSPVTPGNERLGYTLGQTITIYSARIRKQAELYMAAPYRHGSPALWTDEDSMEEGVLKQTLGHEIGHAVGLSHMWDCRSDGIVIHGSVPQITDKDKAEFSDLDFENNTDPYINLRMSNPGWIGLYAFDNRITPSASIKKRVAAYNAWVEQNNNAVAAHNAILDAHNEAVAAGTATQTQAQAEAAADTAYNNYTNTFAYRQAIQKRDLYWEKPAGHDFYKLRLHSYNRGVDGIDPSGSGPFTYAYSDTIMDYNYVITSQVENRGMEGIYAAPAYPAFHNWEYNLGVPQNRVQPGWSSRANPLPIPCDGQAVDQPEQTITTPPPNDGSQDPGSSQNTLPDTPIDLSASYGDGQVRLSWTAASGTVTDYQYRYRVKDTTTWGDWISALLSNSEVLSDTEVLILSLINGTTYEFQVRAMNGESASTASDSFEETPATVPGAPTNLSGYGYNGWVSLSWTAPSDNGGATITDYEYRYSRTSQSFGSSWISAGGINTLKSVFGLTNGTQYKFQVRAKNSAGVSTESNTAYATPVTVPGIPQNVTSTAGDGEVSLYWDAPNSNGGSTITDYEYSYREGGSGDFGSWTSAGTDQWKRVTGLTNDTLYEFRVRARNRIGPGTSAGPIEATPEVPAVAPDAPTDLSASYGDGQISLSWTAPSSSGSSAITHYEYRYATGRSSNHSAFTDWESTDSTDTSYVVTGLTNGTQHLLQVRAVNSELASSASNTAFQTPLAPAVPPESPTDLSASYGDGQISLSWTAPSSSGSSTITHYEYRYATGRSSNHSAFTDWESTDSTDTSYVVTGLTNGTQHLLQVRAVNSERASSASNTAFQTPLAPASAPIWSDIPGPYNLTVGDSFSLDLNSYVTGSPTITKTLGTIPAGLSLSGGVVSGTVTTVEDRSIQFTATNSAGYALSEWVNIVVQAAQ